MTTRPFTKPRELDDMSVKMGALARAIQSRLIHHVVAKTTDGADSAMFNDAAAYTDVNWLEREREVLFRSLPQMAALSSDLPEPGDRVLFDDAGPPIVILRDSDRQVRAYLNICPHRAARLLKDCKRSKRLTCPFHSWTFDLSGRLVGQPHSAAFEGLDREQLNLVPVPVAEWAGMIFILTEPSDLHIDIPDYLGDFASELAALNLASATLVKRTRLNARANWKYVLDTFGEGYHVQTLHPNTVGRFVVSDTVVYDSAGPHHRMSFANKAMIDYAAIPQDAWPHAELRVIYLLFPNTLIQSTPLEGGRNHVVYRIYPGDTPGESATYLATYRTAPPDGGTVEPWIDAHDFQVSVVGGEDYPIAESAQRGLEAVPGQRLAYGRNELALQRFHRHVAERIGRRID